jgi:hypothetical protein
MRRQVLVPIASILIAIVALVLRFVLISDQKLLVAAPAQQAPQCQTFQETGKTVCGKFLSYWQQHGALAQNGFPISDEYVEMSPLNGKPYTVQYFERSEFELHPENQPPYDVLLAQLGTLRFKQVSNGPPMPLYTPMPVPTPEAGKGVIFGKLSYPSEVIPQFQVYALEVNGSRFYSIFTAGNQQEYAISGIEPGTYYVVVYSIVAAKGDVGAAGYTQAVLCGLTYSCSDHTLVAVTVASDSVVRDVNVTDFTSPHDGFPPRP